MRVLSLFAMMSALATPAVEIPVAHPREARTVVRQLNDLGLAASILRGSGDLRVRVERVFEHADDARMFADGIALELGHGAMVLDHVSNASLPAEHTMDSRPVGESSSYGWGPDEYILFEFTRIIAGESVSHTWERRSGQTRIITDSDSDEIVSSTLVVDQQVATITVDDREYDVVPTQARRWIDQLSPGAVLLDARSVGFGGVWPPSEGCRSRDRLVYCVDLAPPEGVDSVEFRGRHLTAQGAWIPAEILQYEDGQLVDRVVIGNLKLGGIAP